MCHGVSFFTSPTDRSGFGQLNDPRSHGRRVCGRGHPKTCSTPFQGSPFSDMVGLAKVGGFVRGKVWWGVYTILYYYPHFMSVSLLTLVPIWETDHLC